MPLENIESKVTEEIKKKRGRPRKKDIKRYIKTGIKRGRPSSYNNKIAEYIFLQLSLGRSLQSICREAKTPCQKTVYNWLDYKSPYFQKKFLNSYIMARELQWELLSDEIIEIADNSECNKYKTIKVKDISTGIIRERRIVNNNNIIRSKLRIKARKWKLAHLRPRKYH